MLTISLQPMTASQVIARLQERMQNVTGCFIPCVQFLVSCQTDLRRALAPTSKRPALTVTEFFEKCIAPLPDKFAKKYKKIMDHKTLEVAKQELIKLTQAAQRQRSSCEKMKRTFLGGLNEGASYGLRKWMSNHGGALEICNDCEIILQTLHGTLEQSSSSTLEAMKQMAAQIRPMAKTALERLQKDVPASHQRISTAHPHLPFFHRLQAALQNLSTFDPADDDVVAATVAAAKPSAVCLKIS
jgi:hypothetical protein